MAMAARSPNHQATKQQMTRELAYIVHQYLLETRCPLAARL
jgi:hypothetical protein